MGQFATTGISALGWIGVRARYLLALGVIAAFFMPAFSGALRPWLAPLVASVLCIAMARIDMLGMMARLANPRQLLRLTAWSVALMAGTPLVLWAFGTAVGLPDSYVVAMVYTGVTPPLTSAAALCLMIGLNAGFALELTLVATLLTPLIGPIVVGGLLGQNVPVDAVDLGLRVGGIILGGALSAVVLRWIATAERLAQNAPALDGTSAIVMWLVVVAVLDGAGAQVASAPLQALGVFGLALALNFGPQILAAPLLRPAWPQEASAAALIWGNRTVALYLAALPFDPVFALFVAFYQVPMLFTPLVTGPYLLRYMPGRVT